MSVKPLASQRDAAIEQLRAHYVHNTLDVHEYEQRVEHVTQANDLATMNLAVADLQPLDLAPPPRQALARPESAPAPLLAVFGSVERHSGWLTARHERVVTVFANAELGVTAAELADGVTTLDVTCVFGNVELTVPVDLTVELRLTGFLGNVEDHGRNPPGEVRGPVLRVQGKCVFGNVEIRRR